MGRRRKNFELKVRSKSEVNAVKLNVEPAKIEVLKTQLLEFFRRIKRKNPVDDVNRVIEKSILGWGKMSPPSFDLRLRAAIGYKTIKRYKEEFDQVFFSPEKESLLEQVEKEVSAPYKPDTGMEDLVIGEFNYENLTVSDRRFLINRNKEYREEFDFNTSSDKVLLDQILYDELLLRKLRAARLSDGTDSSVVDLRRELGHLLKGHPNKDEIFTVFDKLFTALKKENLRAGINETDILDSIRKNMEKLGLLRQQRIESNTNIEGNVGELSVKLDEKLASIHALQDRDKAQEIIQHLYDKYVDISKTELLDLAYELQMLKINSLRGELNPIPQAVYKKIQNESGDITDIEEM